MTTSTTIQRFISRAALLLCCAPFAAAQTGQTTGDAPLTVQEVSCAGNTQTSCDFIREHLYLQAGETLDEDEIRNAELRLSALNNFESVKIRLEKGLQRGTVVVVILVEEASPITTEWLLGAAVRPDAQRGVIAGRIGHQNLFGKGKIADFSAQALVPIAGDGFLEAYGLTLRYADPQLLGSSRYFGIASAGWSKSRSEDVYGNFGNFEAAQLNLSLGRRFGDFSYVMLELNHRSDSDWSYGWWNSSANFQIREHEGRGTKATLIYGWSTEDDLNFPTQGTALQFAVRRDFGANAPDRYPFLRYRKTWGSSIGYWSVKIGGDPSPEYRNALNESQFLALTYSRSLAPGDFIERGRWYIEPGFAPLSHTSSGGTRYSYGLKAGFRAETRRFGLVDLYLSGVEETVR